MNVFVQREQDQLSPRFGKVKGVYPCAQPGYAEEQLSDQHADVLEYTNPPPTPAQVRDATMDVAIAGDATLAQLKAMDSAAFDAWWAANVTTAAQAIVVLKRLARVVIRRLL